MIPVFILAVLLASCGGDGGGRSNYTRPPSTSYPSAPSSAWQIGPIVWGKNYSINCPASFTTSFAIGPCEPHYVTRSTAPLAGKTQIRMRYTIKGKLYGAGCGENSPSAVTVFLQRKGDSWQGEPYRWWATSVVGSAAEGTHEIAASLNDKWTSVISEGTRTQFQAALNETERVGFTFANCDGYGHGARAVGEAQFTLHEFTVR